MKVAVVILNWNGRDWLENFIPNVIENSADHATIVVADNASTDDSVEWLQRNHPQVVIVQNDKNHGFAGGYNEGLKKVDAEYFMLLNSDVEVTRDWLVPLIAQLDQHENVAVVMPKILSWHKKDTFEHAGAVGGFMDKNAFPFCRGRIFADVEQDNGQYDTAREIFWATGCAYLIRSKLYNENGGFDADFFAHMEEIDLCWRLKNQGYRIMCEPASQVYHVGGGALPYESPRKTYLNFRNNLYLLTKNYTGGILFFKVFWRLTLDGIAGTKFLFSGQFKHVWAVIKAHFSFYGKLGTTMRKRKALKKQHRNINLAGMYRRNLIWQFFAKGRKKFSDYDPKDFIS